jgi:hypothetical protein
MNWNMGTETARPAAAQRVMKRGAQAQYSTASLPHQTGAQYRQPAMMHGGTSAMIHRRREDLTR